VMFSRIGRPAPPPSQLVVDEIADEPRAAPEARRGGPRHLICSRGKARIEGVRYSSPPKLPLQPKPHGVGQAIHCPQLLLAPIAEGVESPSLEPPCCLIAPALAPIRTEFALKVSGVEVEGATMIERAVAPGPQTATVVALAPVRGKLSIRRRKIAKHKLAAVDIGFPSKRNHIHPDREESIALGGNKPPSPVTPFG